MMEAATVGDGGCNRRYSYLQSGATFNMQKGDTTHCPSSSACRYFSVRAHLVRFRVVLHEVRHVFGCAGTWVRSRKTIRDYHSDPTQVCAHPNTCLTSTRASRRVTRDYYLISNTVRRLLLIA